MVPLGIMKSERIKMASRTKLHTMIIWPRCEKLRRGRCVRNVRIENELFNEKKERVMIMHIELVDRKTGIAYADKYVDEEQYAEYRRLSVDGTFYVRIVENE